MADTGSVRHADDQLRRIAAMQERSHNMADPAHPDVSAMRAGGRVGTERGSHFPVEFLGCPSLPNLPDTSGSWRIPG